MKGWETSERLLDSGGYESRQRVLVEQAVVEPSESGARWLGVTYWHAVDRFTRGGVRASWSDEGVTLRLLGGVGLLTFAPPELAFGPAIVSCRYEIRGGLLALRAGGSVTLRRSPSVPSTSSASRSGSTCRGSRARCTRKDKARSTPR